MTHIVLLFGVFFTCPGEEVRDCNEYSEFQCPISKLCIQFSQLCDGQADCGNNDNADEHACSE